MGSSKVKKMKKLFFGLFLAFAAVGTSAITTPATARQGFFWYSPDGTVFLGQGANPSTVCPNQGVGCAKGYSSMQTIPVNPSIPAQQTRRHN
jgi:hypothetical protein